jgi:hypothetical protein
MRFAHFPFFCVAAGQDVLVLMQVKKTGQYCFTGRSFPADSINEFPPCYQTQRSDERE